MATPIDTAYVLILPDYSRFLRESATGINRALAGVELQVQRIGDAIDRHFEQAATSANRHLDGIGDQAFTGLKSQAELAGEHIERSFDEAQRGADGSLRHIGGPGEFTGIKTQAKLAGESIERSFSHASVSARASLGGLRVIGYGVGTALAGAFGLVGAAALKMGVSALAASEQAQISFEELLGSGQKAQKFLSDLEHFAAVTPFEMPGLVAAARQLLGAGQAAKDVIPIMTALGDATGALGLDQEQFQRIMLATTQTMNKGKLQGEELLQFLEAGIPIWRLLAEATGLPIPKLREMSEKGELLADDVLPKLFQVMHRDYGGAMARQSHTLTGLWSTFMDTVRNGMRDTLEPLAPLLKSTLAGAIETFGHAFERLPGIVERAMDRLDPDTTRIGATFKGYGQAIIGAIKNALDPDKEGDWSDVAAMIFLGIKQGMGAVADLLPGQPLINAIARGLEEGDWEPLGRAIGARAGELVGFLSAALAEIDWFAVGRTVGKNAVPFAIGFIDALTEGLIEAFRKHPFETLMTVIIVGKWGGVIGKLLGKIPIVGPMLDALFTSGERLFGPFVRFGERLFGRLFEGAVEAISRYFPRLGRLLEGGAGTSILARVRNLTGAFAEAGGNLIRRFGEAVTEEGILVLRNLGQFARALLRPFRGTGRWLLEAGREFLAGLRGGIQAGEGGIINEVGYVIRQLLIDPFRPAGRWLVSAGQWIIRGLVNGMRAMRSLVEGTVRAVFSWIWGGIRDLFGIGSPSRVMYPIGQDILRGLNNGMRSIFGLLNSTVRAVIRAVTRPFTGALRWLSGRGQDIVDGLISGMRSAIGSIGGVLVSIKNAIVGGIRRLFNIRSPSEVMAGLGRNMVAGLVKGLLGSQAGLRGVVKSLGIGTADLLSAVLGGVWERVQGGWRRAVSVLGGAFGALKGLIAPAGGGGIVGLVQQMAASVGWTGAQWSALYQLIMHESGFNPNAQNPTSTAYGLFQFLDSTWASVGARKTSDPAAQIAAGFRYIASRYGSPAGAWAFWTAHHWYDWGGFLPPGVRLGRPWLEPGVTLAGRYALHNDTGQRERVLSPTEQLPRSTSYVVSPGAVQMVFNGPVDAATLPQVEAMVSQAFGVLLRNLRAGA